MAVIKSVGRKDTNYGQLLQYICLAHEGPDQPASFTYLHNMTNVEPDDLQSVEETFRNNSTHQKKRSNGVNQYHEIVSFHPEDTQYIQKHPEILEDITRVYLELRAPHALAVAKPHFDKDHLHLHFMISPNEQGSTQSIRMSKKEFGAFKETMQAYQLEQYPELNHSYVASRDAEKYEQKQEEKITSDELVQMEKRGAEPTDKEKVFQHVETIAREKDPEAFLSALATDE